MSKHTIEEFVITIWSGAWKPKKPESAERNEESKQNVPNDDLISRKMAIEQFWHSKVEFRPTQIDEVMAILKELPSEQPEIIRCKDCKYHDEGYRRISVKWLPCMDICPGSNWYCGSAERRTDEAD